jgi:hypothetical protein
VLEHVPEYFYNSSLSDRAVILLARLPYGLHTLANSFQEPHSEGIWDFVYTDIEDIIADELTRRRITG